MKRYIKSQCNLDYQSISDIVDTLFEGHGCVVSNEYNLREQHRLSVIDTEGDPTDALNRELEMMGSEYHLELREKVRNTYRYNVVLN